MDIPRKSVALVGRPNVGKSSLFNALVGRRVSIVHDQPGVTRDVVSHEMENGHLLMDTGGIGLTVEMTPKAIQEAADQQVEFAIGAADLVLLVTDGQSGVTPLDVQIAAQLRASGKNAVVVANKLDGDEHEDRMYEFTQLGLKEVFASSAAHRRGIETLKDFIVEEFGGQVELSEPVESDRIRISFVGRPNVGKSSLCNCLLDEDRMIVSEVSGTTRDSVSQDLDYTAPNGDLLKFSLVDTAGMRRKAKIDQPVEYFSTLRAEDTIVQSDIVFLVLDALEGVTKQDKLIAGHIINKGKGLVVLVNKWDLAIESFKEHTLPGTKGIDDFREKFTKSLRKEIFFLPDSPVLFVSAKTGFAIERILRSSKQINTRLQTQITTGRLNNFIAKLIEKNPPRFIKKFRFKVYYAVQVCAKPIKLRLYCNQAGRLDDSYKRYLQSNFIKEFDLAGCPVHFDLVGKQPPKKL